MADYKLALLRRPTNEGKWAILDSTDADVTANDGILSAAFELQGKVASTLLAEWDKGANTPPAEPTE